MPAHQGREGPPEGRGERFVSGDEPLWRVALSERRTGSVASTPTTTPIAIQITGISIDLAA